MSLVGCHHSGALCCPPLAVAGSGAAHWVPVQNHACRLFHAVTALVAATAVSSSPTPSPTATARMTSRVTASRPPFPADPAPVIRVRSSPWRGEGHCGALTRHEAGASEQHVLPFVQVGEHYASAMSDRPVRVVAGYFCQDICRLDAAC